MKDINSLEHTKWRCQYHIVFAPKYRRLAIYGELEAVRHDLLISRIAMKGGERSNADSKYRAAPDFAVIRKENNGTPVQSQPERYPIRRRQ